MDTICPIQTTMKADIPLICLFGALVMDEIIVYPGAGGCAMLRLIRNSQLCNSPTLAKTRTLA